MPGRLELLRRVCDAVGRDDSTFERLARLGLVEARETVRGDGYPDRIVYAITPAGRRWRSGCARC